MPLPPLGRLSSTSGVFGPTWSSHLARMALTDTLTTSQSLSSRRPLSCVPGMQVTITWMAPDVIGLPLIELPSSTTWHGEMTSGKPTRPPFASLRGYGK